MANDDGSRIEKDFSSEIEDWKTVDDFNNELETEDDVAESYYLSSILKEETELEYEVFPVEFVEKKDFGRQDVQEAMQKELEKYKAFGAFEEVSDDGQGSVPIKWVVTKHALDGKN